jgi:hypothetical protein
MEKECVSCRKPKADSVCGVCEGAVCRKCRLFLDAEAFPFAGDLPAALKHTFYCGLCHDEHVAPFQTQYEENLEKAKGVTVLFKNSKSTVRYQGRSVDGVVVKESPDRNQAILQLAFLAAKAGFNAIVEVEVSSQKVRNYGWQKSAWSGQGTPANVSSYQLERKDV